MKNIFFMGNPVSKGYKYRVFAFLMALASILIPLATILFFYYHAESVGTAQPIPFSHKLHAGKKEVSCYFCHPGARIEANPGIPPMETCMLCHERIIIHYPPIETVRSSYYKGIPIEWNRIVDLPDYAYFNHQVHLRKDVDCGQCHGEVKGMDRVINPQKFTMGFCVDCHRSSGASQNCFICHR